MVKNGSNSLDLQGILLQQLELANLSWNELMSMVLCQLNNNRKLIDQLHFIVNKNRYIS